MFRLSPSGGESDASPHITEIIGDGVAVLLTRLSPHINVTQLGLNTFHMMIGAWSLSLSLGYVEAS